LHGRKSLRGKRIRLEDCGQLFIATPTAKRGGELEGTARGNFRCRIIGLASIKTIRTVTRQRSKGTGGEAEKSKKKTARIENREEANCDLIVFCPFLSS